MLRDRINFHSKEFTKNDNKICTWLLKEDKGLLPSNIIAAAELMGVSTSALTRFCQKIQLKGWNELVFSLKQETKEKDKSRASNQTLNDIIYSLSRTENSLNKNAIQLLAKKINEKEHVYLYGESFTELASIQFTTKLNKIGISTRVFNVASDTAIIMPRKNSIHIMISMSGMNPNIKAVVNKIQKQAKEKQIIYAIGSTKYSNVANDVNEFIGGEYYQSSALDPYELPDIANYIITYILNKLFDAVYIANKESNDESISNIAKRKER